MKKIVLISCGKAKLDKAAKAKELYTGMLFKYNMKFAESLKPHSIYILSAKYGLLELEQIIEPYDKTLNKLREREKKSWADLVLAKLRTKTDFSEDQFIFLAGINYRKYLIPALSHVKIPFEGLPIGKQLGELKRRVK